MGSTCPFGLLVVGNYGTDKSHLMSSVVRSKSLYMSARGKVSFAGPRTHAAGQLPSLDGQGNPLPESCLSGYQISGTGLLGT